MLETAPLPSPVSPIPGALEQDKHVVRPASWFERIQPSAIFGRVSPLEVELGSGDGSFLVEWARRHPEQNFLGVERLLGRLRKLDRKAQRAGVENVRCLRIEASYCVEYLLPPESIVALHLYFPDPWPKRRHRKNRLVNEQFGASAARALQAGGSLHLRTDDEDYFGHMQSVFRAIPGFLEEPTPPDLAEVLTDFERQFNAAGRSTLRASYRRE